MIPTFADRMSFANFANPYRNPAGVPEEYRKHLAIARRFRPDGSQAEAVVAAAKARVEQMILGEEVGDG